MEFDEISEVLELESEVSLQDVEKRMPNIFHFLDDLVGVPMAPSFWSRIEMFRFRAYETRKWYTVGEYQYAYVGEHDRDTCPDDMRLTREPESPFCICLAQLSLPHRAQAAPLFQRGLPFVVHTRV